METDEIIAVLRERPIIDEGYDDARLEGPLHTTGLIQSALETIGGGDFKGVGYRTQVFTAAGLAHLGTGAGDWHNARRETARAYARIQRALLSTTDKEKVLGLVQIRVPIAAGGAEAAE